MKKIVLTVVLVCSMLAGYAQQIDKQEYFIDTDPGPGNGVALAITPTDSVTNSMSISTLGLTVGYHRAYFRYRYTNGAWGNTGECLFYVYSTTPPAAILPAPQLLKGEYFIDTDPEAGHGVAILVSSAADSIVQNISPATSGLAIGKHSLFVRYMDTAGSWGHAQSVTFRVCSAPMNIPAITGTTNVCAGNTLSLSTTPVAGATGYSWTGPNNFTANTQTINITNAQPAASGVYQVQAYRAGGTTCDTSDFGSITALVFPCNGPQITAMSPTFPFCRGEAVSISFIPGGIFNANNIFKLQLSNVSGSFASPTQIGSLSGTTGGTIPGTIPGAQTTGNGYRMRIVSTSPIYTGADNGYDLSIMTKPSITQATITASGPFICSNGSITLSVPTVAGNYFQWTNNGNTVGGATNASYEATSAGTYTVTVSNTAGCSRTSADFVLGTGGCTISAPIPPSNTICQGGNIAISFTTTGGYSANNVFTAQLSNANGLFTIPKDIGTLSGNVSGTINASLPYSLNTGSNYRIRVTSSNPSGLVGPVNSTGLTLAVAPVAASVTIATSTGNNNVCVGSSNVLSVPANAGYTYQWRRNNAVTGTNSNSFSATQGGDYTVTATNQAGCFRTSTVKPLSLKNLPLGTFVIATLSSGNKRLKASANQALYQWYLNSVAISGATGGTYTATVGGDYHVVVTKAGCTTTGAPQTVTIGSSPRSGVSRIEEITAHAAMMSIYPNPSNSEAALLIQTEGATETYGVRVMDVAGRIVAELTVNSGEVTSFGSGLSAGIYTIEAVREGKKLVSRWVKQ